MLPIHNNNHRFNIFSSNTFLYPETKKIVVENNYDKIEIEKIGMFKRELTIVAINTKYTYSSVENLVNPHIVYTGKGFKMCKHPQELLYRDERSVFRKILDCMTGRKDYDLFMKDSRKENNPLTVVTTTHRDMFPEVKIKTFKQVVPFTGA